MTEFAAFLSYARLDDEYEDGMATKFKKRLEAAVRQWTGKPDFQIFQDTKDIRWGQQWRQRIEQALGEVFVLIPILTPLYFGREACREEYDLFLKREKALKRNDLILPVYWIECDKIENGRRGEGDTWVKDLSKRQWADWRPLRWVPLTTRQALQAIDGMALQIKQTLAVAPTTELAAASPRPSVQEWLHAPPDLPNPPDYGKKGSRASPTADPTQTNASPTPVPTGMTPLKYLQTSWAALLRQDKIPPELHKSVAVYYIRVYARPVAVEDGCITLEFSKALYKELVEKPENRREVEKLFEHILGKPYRVMCTLAAPGAASP